MATSLPWIILFAGAWCVIMGILHDIFVLTGEHGKTYDRNLLRLLFDGHILITCGVMLLISYSGLKSQENWAYFVAIASCVSLLIYCMMIWKFLKSVFTTLLSAGGLTLLILTLLSK